MNNLEIVQILLDSDSNPTLVNKHGVTAMQITSDPKIIKLVTEATNSWREKHTAHAVEDTGQSRPRTVSGEFSVHHVRFSGLYMAIGSLTAQTLLGGVVTPSAIDEKVAQLHAIKSDHLH